MSVPLITGEDNLLLALSDFWVRMFEDSDELKAIYDVTLAALGQEYLSLMDSILNLSVKDAPLTHKRYFKLISLNSNSVFGSEVDAVDKFNVIDGISSSQSYPIENSRLDKFEFLTDRVYKPLTIYSVTEDFAYFPYNDCCYFFNKDIFQDKLVPSKTVSSARQARKGFAVRYAETASTYNNSFWLVASPYKNSGLGTTFTKGSAGNSIAIKFQANTVTTAVTTELPLPILRIEPDADGVPNQIRVILQKYTGHTYPGTTVQQLKTAIESDINVRNLITLVHFPLQVIGTSADHRLNALNDVVATTGSFTSLTGGADTSVQLVLWARNVEVDEHDLYNTYGYIINHYKESSESYRSFLRGIFKYLIDGPTRENIKLALDVIAGYSVIRSSGEVLVDYINTTTTSTTHPEFEANTIVVVTNRAAYAFPSGTPMREDILLLEGEPNVGYQFSLFERLANVFRVEDYISDSSWWYNEVIPSKLLPDQEYLRRVASPDLLSFTFGGSDLIQFGDPGVFFGADATGYVPTGRPPLVFRPGYYLMDKLLKYHTFLIEFPAESRLPAGVVSTISDIQDLLLDGRLAHTYFFVRESTKIIEHTFLTESLKITVHTIGDVPPDYYLYA